MNDQIERHFHWEFMAYNGEPLAPQMQFPITVEVIGYSSEENALIAAKDIVVRDQYYLRRVWECNVCKFQSEMKDTFRKMVS